MKIALFPNYEKEGTKTILEKIKSILNNNAAEYSVYDSADESAYKDCDIVITIGGDGTLIKHAKAASVYSKPCLGINTGRLGFLTNLDSSNLSLLEKLFSGEYEVESRMMLSVTAKSGDKIIYSGCALNEAVVSSGSVARITDLVLSVNDDDIEYRADGVIISSPTGSTAYSMSAGGPIIDPAVRCITVTPVCSHSLTARPLLASQDSVLSLSLCKTSRTGAVLTVDGGRCCDVDKNTKIIISKASYDVKLINIGHNTIFKAVAQKF